MCSRFGSHGVRIVLRLGKRAEARDAHKAESRMRMLGKLAPFTPAMRIRKSAVEHDFNFLCYILTSNLTCNYHQRLRGRLSLSENGAWPKCTPLPVRTAVIPWRCRRVGHEKLVSCTPKWHQSPTAWHSMHRPPASSHGTHGPAGD